MTLPWMNLIRENLAKLDHNEEYTNSEKLAIKSFLAPIILYGESEEKRIEQEFKQGGK